jgi:chromosome segregation ATPase
MVFDLTALQNSAIIVTAVGTVGYGFYQAFKKARKHALDSAALQEEKIQKRITDASEQERERYERLHNDDEDRLSRLRAIADEWKEIAQQRALKIEDLIVKVEEKISRITALENELKQLEAKYERVLEVNTDLVQRMTDLEKKVNI